MKTTYIKKAVSGNMSGCMAFCKMKEKICEQQAGIIYYSTDDQVDFGYYAGKGNWKFYKDTEPDIDTLQEMYLIFPDKEIYIYKAGGKFYMRLLTETDMKTEGFDEVFYSEEKHYMWGSQTGGVENGFYSVSEDSGVTYHLPEVIAPGKSYVYTMRYYFKAGDDGVLEPVAERIVSVDGGIRR